MLARGDALGVGLIEGTPEGALGSFRAAFVCVPAFLVLRLVGWSESGVPDGGVFRGLVAELLGFVIAWTGFALAALPATEAMQKRSRWPLFIAVWNYANIVQYALLILATLLPMLLGVPASVVQALSLATFGYVLWLEWFVARTTLGASGLQATGFVMIDVALSLFVAGLVAKLSAG